MVETLIELCEKGMRDAPRPDMFRYKDGGRWISVSTAAFEERVERTFAGLSALGVGKGDRVAILSENRFEWAIADLAILRAGAIVVPIYPTLIPSQIGSLFESAKPKVVFCSNAEQLERACLVSEALPPEHRLVVFDEVADERAGTLASLQREGGATGRPKVRPSDVATILYTSGTTGDPKGVMLSHENIVQNVLNVRTLLPVSPSDAYLSFLPLSHIFERMGGHFTMIMSGVSIAYAESIHHVSENLLEIRPTVVFAVPRLFEKFHERAALRADEGGPLSRLVFQRAEEVARVVARRRVAGERIGAYLRLRERVFDLLVYRKFRRRLGGRVRFFVSGGAPLAPELAELFYGMGMPALEGYGLTETSPVIALNVPEAIRFGSVGRPIPNVEVQVAEDGEILTRSRSVMVGYYNLPRQTEQVITKDGWFHTGDLGRIDEDGYVYIEDRKKDIIVTSEGKNLAPRPIERRLERFRRIESAALIGDHHKYVVALLVPNFKEIDRFAKRKGIPAMNGKKLLDDPRVRAFFAEAVDRVNDRLSRHERVKRFALLDRPFSEEEGELTPTLKVKRHVIEKTRAGAIDSLYEEHNPVASP